MSFTGLSIVGRKGALHCFADSMVIFFQRSRIFGFLGSFTVRSKITGVILSMPSSVHFAISQSKRSPFAMLVAMIMLLFFGFLIVCSDCIFRTAFLLFAETMRAEAMLPRPSNSSARSPVFSLRTAKRCRGWLSVSSTVG